MKCIYCTHHEVDPRWEPYCGPHCCIEAEVDGLLVCQAFSLREQLRPLRDRLVEREKSKRRCWPKVQHETRGAAEAQMRSILKRGLEKDVGRIHVYRCDDCRDSTTGRRFFHVGHGRGRV